MNIDKFEYKNGCCFYNGEKLSQTKNSQGYLRVMINGKAKRVHRLIAKKYLSNPNNLPCVDHIDGDKDNNNVSNLEWVTYAENSRRAYHNNINMRIYTGRKKGVKPIISNKDGIKVIHLSLRDCAKYLNRDVAAVYRCLKGEWGKCNGHNLYYLE